MLVQGARQLDVAHQIRQELRIRGVFQRVNQETNPEPGYGEQLINIVNAGSVDCENGA